MTIWLAFTALILACMAFGYLVRMLQERSKRERREYAEQIEHYQERGRHARTQPRTALVKPRAHLPIPGPGTPQPGRDSGPGTVTFDRLSDTGEMAKLATTAAAADNNAWLERMSADAVPGV